MILKNFELEKNNYKSGIYLFYGQNEGYKKEQINFFKLNKKNTLVISFSEKEILENKEKFYNIVLSKSFFDDERIIIIDYVTDKIIEIILEIVSKNINDISLILNSGPLEKKSKLRKLFEDNKTLICVAFYPDNYLTLSKIANDFFKQKKISISQSDINNIINKSVNNRDYLKQDLTKIELLSLNRKLVSSDLIKLVNQNENQNFSEIIDSCFDKNLKKIINMLNENNFGPEDGIIFVKTFILKAKKLLKLSINFSVNNDINMTLDKAKPPIFWKEKEVVKQHIYKWKPNKIKDLLFNLNDLELQIKKNLNLSIKIVTNFIFKNCC